MVGVGGSGKQSLTKLASFIAGYKTYQIILTRTYNINNLADDFKYLYRTAGLEGKGITFLFTDNDIKDEGFLEYFNNVLSSGENANLFPKEDIDEITSDLIPLMKKADPRRPPTRDNLYDFFINRARNNLHIVLCFSPVGEKFRNRSLKFPGLISGCVVDWFHKWLMEALVEVSHYFIKENRGMAFKNKEEEEDSKIECTPSVKDNLVEAMAYVHDSVSVICEEYYEKFRRHVHVTPKSFLSFLDGYKRVYKDKKEQIRELHNKMNGGLYMMNQATMQIADLKTTIEIKVI